MDRTRWRAAGPLARWKTSRKARGAAVAAAAAMLGTASEAHAGDGEIVALVGVGAAFVGADIAFAANGLRAADKGHLDRDDGWLIAQTVVTSPQTLVFNAVLFGFNHGEGRQAGDIATWIGLLPTTAVSALTTHAIWGLADHGAPPDALAGVSVLVGANTAMSMATLGRATSGNLHTRPVGALEMAWSAPGTAVGIYESTFNRPQQGAWIALTAWSGALFVHGVASVIADQTDESDWEREKKNSEMQRAAKGGLWPSSLAIAPTVVSDGVASAPGVAISGLW